MLAAGAAEDELFPDSPDEDEPDEDEPEEDPFADDLPESEDLPESDDESADFEPAGSLSFFAPSPEPAPDPLRLSVR